jgi:hypothetical protein
MGQGRNSNGALSLLESQVRVVLSVRASPTPSGCKWAIHRAAKNVMFQKLYGCPQQSEIVWRELADGNCDRLPTPFIPHAYMILFKTDMCNCQNAVHPITTQKKLFNGPLLRFLETQPGWPHLSR